MKFSRCNFKVEETFKIVTPIRGYDVSSEYHHLFSDGTLVTFKNYSWDGASGAIDTESIITASCIHDAFCEFINNDLLPRTSQKIADKFFVDTMAKYWCWQKNNGTPWQKIKAHALMPFTWFRRKYSYRAVRIYQENKTGNPKKIINEVP